MGTKMQKKKRRCSQLKANSKEYKRLKRLRKKSTPLRDKFLADLNYHHFSATTVEKYSNELLRYTAYFWKSPADLMDEDLRSYFNYLENERHYSNSTIGIAYGALLFFYTHTCPRDMPFFRIFRIRKDKTLPVVLSREEVRKILSLVDDVRHHACLTLIYSCGLRHSEGINIEVGDIDKDMGMVYVRNGKGAKPRAVPLPKRTLEILRNMWKTHRHPRLLFPAYSVAVKGKSQSNGVENFPVKNTTLWRHFKKALAASGCHKDATIHSLRHSYAVHLLEEGTPLFTLKENLGHSSIYSTMLYAHLTPRIRRNSSGSLEALMSDLP
jgi:site-specific recombinase XerD